MLRRAFLETGDACVAKASCLELFLFASGSAFRFKMALGFEPVGEMHSSLTFCEPVMSRLCISAVI